MLKYVILNRFRSYTKKQHYLLHARRIAIKFGYFDDSNQEYVITTPKTPLPWINYLGCNEFFSLISNTCGGYTFYKDAKLLRMTRYRYNDVPGDVNGKYFYIPAGSPQKPTWTAMNAATASATAALPHPRIR